MTWFKTQIGKADQVVEEWHEGSTFYRKYASGFIEQGGAVTGKGMVTVTLPKAFSTTDYYVGSTCVANDTVWDRTVLNRTTQTFELGLHESTQQYQNIWYACGY